MFTEIGLRNFQAHRRLDIELDPGVNVIVGPSDIGKSAVVRALYWLAFNQPAGDEFRSYWGGRTVAMAKTVDGDVVKRVRTHSENYYQLNDDKLGAPGRGVPDQVQQALNLGPVNFMRQLDPPFLLSLTPGQVAKELNEIANLKQVDNSISWLNRYTRQTQSDIREVEKSQARMEEELAALPDLDAVEKKLAKAEKLVKKRNDCTRQANNLHKMVQNLDREEKRLDSLTSNRPEGVGELLDKAFGLVDKQEVTRNRISALTDLHYRITGGEQHLEDMREERHELATQLEEELKDKPCPLCGRT
jgi:exonuclease SbcC